MTALLENLHPAVTAFLPENLFVPFTDYSRWERKHAKGSVGVRTHARVLTPFSASRVRKICKSTVPEAKRQRSDATSTAQVRLQPVAVCNHGQGIRRKSVGGDSHIIRVYKGRGQRVHLSASPEKQQKSGRLGRSHEPTNIRLLRVIKLMIYRHACLIKKIIDTFFTFFLFDSSFNWLQEEAPLMNTATTGISF